jgi:chromate reductase, NAD(P)H dehydrogenase (quinone)
MTDPLNLVAIIGSLRKQSFNRSVFEAARALLPEQVSLRELPLEEVPFFNEDLEKQGDPAAVLTLKASARESDGLIIFTPQYNGGTPAVTKNAIDWLSRPYGNSPLRDKPVGTVAATTGRHDVQGVRDQIAVALNSTAAAQFPTSLGLASISRALSDGEIVDPDLLHILSTWLGEFVEFARAAASQQKDEVEQ